MPQTMSYEILSRAGQIKAHVVLDKINQNETPDENGCQLNKTAHVIFFLYIIIIHS